MSSIPCKHTGSTAKRYDYTYGAGFDLGLDYSGSRQFGIRAKDGTYSIFTDGTFKPNIYGSAGVFMPLSRQVTPQSKMLMTFIERNRQQEPKSRGKYNLYQTPIMPPHGINYTVPYNSNYNMVYPQNEQSYAAPLFKSYQPPVIPQSVENYPVPYRFYQPQNVEEDRQNDAIPASNIDEAQKHQY